MDPKDLADLHQNNKLAIAAAEAEKKAQGDALRAKMQDAGERLSQTMQSVVLPYLDDVKGRIPEIEFNVGREAGTMKPVSLEISLKNGGRLMITRQGTNINCQARSPGGAPADCRAAFRLKTVDDLTVENVGLLVKWLLEQYKLNRMPD